MTLMHDERMGKPLVLGLEYWLQLDEEAWNAIRQRLEGHTPTLAPWRARPHQIPAVEAAKQHYLGRGTNRGRLIMPCGTGKSLIGFFIAEAMNAREILIAVPSLALVKQSLTTWTREFAARGEVPDWLCVCSDETTGSVNTDEFAYDLPVPPTTDPNAITAFLRRSNEGRRITFTTYQSSGRLAEAAQRTGNHLRPCHSG
jgi:predicted helicase